MTSQISNSIIESLVSIGKLADIDGQNIAEVVVPLREHEPLCRLHWESWDSVCARLSVVDHIALLKGLVMAERYAGRNSGSVAPGIWVYGKLEDRIPGKEAVEIALWVIERSNNGYMPFGSSRLREDFIRRQGQFTKQEYDGSVSFELKFNAFVDHNRRLHDELERQKIAKEAKAKRLEARRVEAVAHQKRKLENEQVRKEIVSTGEQFGPVARLELIMKHPGLPLTYFPEEWSNVGKDEIELLDRNMCTELAARICVNKSKPWKQLGTLILSTLLETENA